MKRATVLLAVALSMVFGCHGQIPSGEGGVGGSPPTYDGPSASPICGSDAYDRACHEWLPDAIPYCYAPAKRGNVGPPPFPSCATVTGGDAPPLDTGDNGWASWWCCPYHEEGDGGAVILDSGFAGGGGTDGGIGT